MWALQSCNGRDFDLFHIGSTRMGLESSPLILADREAVGPRGSIGGCRLGEEAFPHFHLRAGIMEVSEAFKVTEGVT